MSDKVTFALRLAELGFHILPCQPNSKNPKKGFRYGVGATRDPDIIREWFEDDPAMNYGVCPREKGVIIDLDVKPDANGVEEWRAVCSDHGKVETFTIRSPSGGYHLYFWTEFEVGNAHNFGKGVGIDVRGTGGYVVGPGCTLLNGSYDLFRERDVAQAPAWLVGKYLRQPGAKSDLSHVPLVEWDLPENVGTAKEYLKHVEPAVEGLNGNDTTYETVQWVRDYGISDEKCLELMFTTGWNNRCEPPWTSQELEVCIRNAYRYGQNQVGAKAIGLMERFESELLTKQDNGTLTDDERTLLGMDAHGNLINPGEPPPPPDPFWFEPVMDMNERYAVIEGSKHHGKVVDLSNPREPQLLKSADFHSLYKDYKLAAPKSDDNPKPKPRPISAWWEEWLGRRKISGLEFVPPGSNKKPGPNAHNLWRGFAVDPIPGHAHERLLQHIHDHVCHGDRKLYRWFLAWMADMVQRPGNKPGVAVALRGDYGVGKSVIMRYLAGIFGNHALAVSQSKHVTGNFNAHMAGLILLGAEEGVWSGSKQAESALNHLITAEDMTLEHKGHDPIKLDSHVHVISTSNADWAVPVPAGDRRWAVFNVLPDRKDDQEYWAPIHAALMSGVGPANLLCFLMTYDYDQSVLFRPPMTAAKAEQAMESMDSISLWFLDVLRGDRDPMAGKVREEDREHYPDGVFDAMTPKEIVYADYQAWCEQAGRRFQVENNVHFWRKMRDRSGGIFHESRPDMPEGNRPRMIAFAPREVCQDAFAGRIGCRWENLASS